MGGLVALSLTACNEEAKPSKQQEQKAALEQAVVKEDTVTAKAPEGADENTLKDSRDGKTYRMVKIGGQTWMAQNLDFETEGSYCFKDDSANCAKTGRLYVWEAAQKACPAGWHLPSKDELVALVNAAGGEDSAGKQLKSTSGWSDDRNGTDSLGFSAFPTGQRLADGSYFNPSGETYFWSSTKAEGPMSYSLYLTYDSDAGRVSDRFGKLAFPVRCLED